MRRSARSSLAVPVRRADDLAFTVTLGQLDLRASNRSDALKACQGTEADKSGKRT